MLLSLTTQCIVHPAHLWPLINFYLWFSLRHIFFSLLYVCCAQTCLSYYTVILKDRNALECECVVPKQNQHLLYIQLLAMTLSVFGRNRGRDRRKEKFLYNAALDSEKTMASCHHLCITEEAKHILRVGERSFCFWFFFYSSLSRESLEAYRKGRIMLSKIIGFILAFLLWTWSYHDTS